MFPLAHNFLVKRLLDNPDYHLGERLTPFQVKLLMLGSVMPDLVSGMGMDRNFGHLMGEPLYAFCQEKYPKAMPFALGVWLHGADPCGFDYYADEHWQGGKGWCFQQCVPYIDDVVKACNLPAEWGLWKAHNFIEMMADMECAAAVPALGYRLLDAGADEDIKELIKEVLVDFGGAAPEKVNPVISFMGEMFSIYNVSPEDMGDKYAKQLVRRHDIHGADPQMIAAVLRRIYHDLKDDFWRWYEQAERCILTEIEKKVTILTK